MLFYIFKYFTVSGICHFYNCKKEWYTTLIWKQFEENGVTISYPVLIEYQYNFKTVLVASIGE